MAYKIEQTSVDSGIPRSSDIPSAIIDNGLLSETSLASDCFINQRFSNKLQAFLIGYVDSIYSNYSVYK
jgi:hypothetical protein